jgi:flagellar biosynthesis/type III secretory pathway protein FliH
MFQKHIDHIDEKLEKGIIELAWTSEGSKEFYEEAVDEGNLDIFHLIQRFLKLLADFVLYFFQ